MLSYATRVRTLPGTGETCFRHTLMQLQPEHAHSERPVLSVQALQIGLLRTCLSTPQTAILFTAETTFRFHPCSAKWPFVSKTESRLDKGKRELEAPHCLGTSLSIWLQKFGCRTDRLACHQLPHLSHSIQLCRMPSPSCSGQSMQCCLALACSLYCPVIG